MTPVFAKICNIIVTTVITEEDYKLTEKFFIILYSTINNTDHTNRARQMLFTHGE